LKIIWTCFFVLSLPLYCFLQPVNDNCINAINLCANESIISNNLLATASICVGCEDGELQTGNFCFELNNSVWFSFTTNEIGGSVSATISNINCTSDTVPSANNELQAVIISASTPCDETTYEQVSNCISAAANNITLLANSLNANTTYYIQVDGAESGSLTASECGFSILISGDGVEPIINAGEDLSIFPGETIQLSGVASGDFYWLPVDYLSDPTVLNPIASPVSTTTYILSANINGCMFFDEVEVIVQNPLSIPNTITPNNDGFNDTWRIGNISNYPSAQVSIFDRWGQSVFKVTGYTPDKRWNGTNNGLRIPSGTYFYIIELRVGETTKIYNGSINVIR
jgi:gliding motility-associated-like protein